MVQHRAGIVQRPIGGLSFPGIRGGCSRREADGAPNRHKDPLPSRHASIVSYMNAVSRLMIENMEAIERDGVKGTLEKPLKPTDRALVLTHGAGSDSNAALLKAISAQLCSHGWTVLRCDL